MIDKDKANSLLIKYHNDTFKNTDKIISEFLEKALDNVITNAATVGRKSCSFDEILVELDEKYYTKNYNKSNILAATRELAQKNGFHTDRDEIMWG